MMAYMGGVSRFTGHYQLFCKYMINTHLHYCVFFAAVNNDTEICLTFYKEKAMQCPGDIFLHVPLLLGHTHCHLRKKNNRSYEELK